MTTEAAANPNATTAPRRASRRRGASGPDRLTLVLLSAATFLVLLALLASQLHAASHLGTRQVVVLRKIYRTTVIETLARGSGPTGTSVSQSVASSGSPGVVGTAARTRTS